MVILGIFLIQLGLNVAKGKVSTYALQDVSNASLEFEGMTLLIITVMNIITTIMEFIIVAMVGYLTVNEAHKTRSDELKQLVTKGTILGTVNSALMFYILFIISGVASPVSIVAQVINFVTVTSVIKIAKNIIQLKICWKRCGNDKLKTN